ncbi:MORN repeat-containing protein 5-like [Bombyx mandarina]|uniref:MORN repeat-containing protein 5 n=1 Tax=Bombyx mandarina TaxID=7092 RepID=A0A6J2JX27_BOMMA|nr:MORN repeat-containing protein 5-like [Bombyx mandarina]
MSADKSHDVSVVSEKRTSQWEELMRTFSEAHKDACNVSDKRTSQWEELMRKFSEANKDGCKAMSQDIPRAYRSLKRFPTGSQYDGTWDVLGMSGYGTYTFPNEVKYVGEFEDGMFHGQGELRYPSGVILRGKWKKGLMYERKLIFADGLEYSENDWKYCRMPDRRLTIEYDNGLQPAGSSYLTADQPTRDVPPGYYDTGDGFYDPKTKIVYNADDLSAIIRSPSLHEQKWIEANCRTSPETSFGPRPELYEKWSKPQMELDVPPHGFGSRPTSITQKFYYDKIAKSEAADEHDSQSFVRDSPTFTDRWNHKSFIKFKMQYKNIENDSDD